LFKDDILVQVARRAPQSLRQLGEFRAIQPRDLDKLGSGILQAIERGKRVPEQQCPAAFPSEPLLSAQQAALASLLSAILQHVANKHRVASTMIATMDDLQRLVDAHSRGVASTSSVLTGWRGDLVGKEILAALDGKASVRWDAESQSLAIDPS
jgi:ribonuclease D